MTVDGEIEPGARLRRADGLRVTPVGEDLVLFDPGDYRAITLNQWAREIWHLCDGERELAAIIDELDGRFEAEAGRIGLEVHQVVSEMVSAGVLCEAGSAD